MAAARALRVTAILHSFTLPFVVSVAKSTSVCVASALFSTALQPSMTMASTFASLALLSWMVPRYFSASPMAAVRAVLSAGVPACTVCTAIRATTIITHFTQQASLFSIL